MSLRDEIILETMKLFSLKGYVNTGINEIIGTVGSSKGGFYNHFSSKEELFFEVLANSQRIWRVRVLDGLNQLESPLMKVIRLLENYRDHYLKDSENFPGGCIFVTLSVELDDQYSGLAQEVNKGFIRLRNMLNKLLQEAKQAGELKQGVDTDRITEMIFSGMIGSSVQYGMEKSIVILDRSINALIDYLNEIHIDSRMPST